MRVKLSDITEYSKGVQINGDDLIENGEFIYLNGGINPSGRWDSTNVPGNTVTISEGGNSSGYVNYISEPFWCGAHCYYLYGGPKNSKYMYYALKSQQDRLFSIRSGACMPNIKKTDLGNFEFEFDSDENRQNEVVSVLTKVESVIVERKKELDLLDELIKARFVELFGSINDNKFDYNVMTLQDVCEPIKDGTHQTPTYTEDTINGYKFLSSKDVTSGKVDWTHLKYIPEELHNELYKRISPRKGDVLLAKNGTTGVAAIVDKDEVFDIYVSLALLRPLGLVTSEYLCSVVNSVETKQQFDSSLKGIGVPNLHLGEIKKTKIVVPPIEEQEKFADFVKQVDKSKVVDIKAA